MDCDKPVLSSTSSSASSTTLSPSSTNNSSDTSMETIPMASPTDAELDDSRTKSIIITIPQDENFAENPYVPMLDWTSHMMYDASSEASCISATYADSSPNKNAVYNYRAFEEFACETLTSEESCTVEDEMPSLNLAPLPTRPESGDAHNRHIDRDVCGLMEYLMLKVTDAQYANTILEAPFPEPVPQLERTEVEAPYISISNIQTSGNFNELGANAQDLDTSSEMPILQPEVVIIPKKTRDDTTLGRFVKALPSQPKGLFCDSKFATSRMKILRKQTTELSRDEDRNIKALTACTRLPAKRTLEALKSPPPKRRHTCELSTGMKKLVGKKRSASCDNDLFVWSKSFKHRKPYENENKRNEPINSPNEDQGKNAKDSVSESRLDPMLVREINERAQARRKSTHDEKKLSKALTTTERDTKVKSENESTNPDPQKLQVKIVEELLAEIYAVERGLKEIEKDLAAQDEQATKSHSGQVDSKAKKGHRSATKIQNREPTSQRQVAVMKEIDSEKCQRNAVLSTKNIKEAQVIKEVTISATEKNAISEENLNASPSNVRSDEHQDEFNLIAEEPFVRKKKAAKKAVIMQKTSKEFRGIKEKPKERKSSAKLPKQTEIKQRRKSEIIKENATGNSAANVPLTEQVPHESEKIINVSKPKKSKTTKQAKVKETIVNVICSKCKSLQRSGTPLYPKVWELSDDKRVKIMRYRQNWFVDLRAYKREEDRIRSTRKGLMLTMSQWRELNAIMPDIMKEVEKYS